jgi:Rhodopirellula transposase DDE domain
LGGGRLAKELVEPTLQSTFDLVIDSHTAGCPVNATRWTYLRTSEIKNHLKDKGLQVSRSVIKRLVQKAGLGRRKMSKKLTMKKEIDGRNEQFEVISKQKAEHLSKGYAVLSIDTKSKENLGMFYRDGQITSSEPINCYDHDFTSFSSGRVVPYGVYDVGLNAGYMILGSSADTAEFNVACLRQYWADYGSKNYTNNEPILILADGGGSNASANRLFKQEIQGFADHIGRVIRIAHYPPYCSKYNPIEHRLFPYITKAWEGVMLDSRDTMKQLIEQRTKHLKSGLKIIVDFIEETFKKGVTVFDDYMDYLDINFDEINPKWNYTLSPLIQNTTVI